MTKCFHTYQTDSQTSLPCSVLAQTEKGQWSPWPPWSGYSACAPSCWRSRKLLGRSRPDLWDLRLWSPSAALGRSSIFPRTRCCVSSASLWGGRKKEPAKMTRNWMNYINRQAWGKAHSHVRVLEGRPGRVQCESSHGFDGRIGKVQLQGFTFTWARETWIKRRGNDQTHPTRQLRMISDWKRYQPWNEATQGLGRWLNASQPPEIYRWHAFYRLLGWQLATSATPAHLQKYSSASLRTYCW